MPVYFDASAITPLFLTEPATPWARATVSYKLGARLVSDFAAAEVASAISRHVRTKLISAEGAEHLLERFDHWVSSDTSFVTTTSADIVDAGLLVRRFEFGLRTPDALHLVLARRCGATLATLDQRMYAAAAVLRLQTIQPPV